MRAIWKKGNVYSLKLRDDVYTLCQMAGHSMMQFFDIFRSVDEWQGLDLSDVDIFLNP